MANISSLPIEMLAVVSTHLSNKDILKLRSTSRTLRNGTAFEFCQRFLKKPIEIIGTAKLIRALTETLCSPGFSSAKVPSQELVVFKPVAGDMPPGYKTTLPTAKDVKALFAAMPRLEALVIGAEELDFDLEDNGDAKETKALIKSREDIAPALLKGLARVGSPTSRLATLDIYEITIEGTMLTKVLSAHRHSLRKVSLELIKLKDGKKAVTWRQIFEALLELDLQELTLKTLLDPAADECLVMCKESYGDEDPWNSYQTPALVKRRADGEGGGGEVTGLASYTRSEAFFEESYVKMGLRKVLRIEDFPIWPR